MIVPESAPVRPRVTSPSRADSFLLEDEILRLLDEGACLPIELTGGPGSGKTTALKHLAAVFSGHPRLMLCDAESLQDVHRAAHEKVVVWTSVTATGSRWLYPLRLCAWGTDELIEYLLARNKAACGSVMQRLTSADRRTLLGNPELLAMVLDELAEDCAVPDFSSAFNVALVRRLGDLNAFISAMSRPISDEHERLTVEGGLKSVGMPASALRLLRHMPVMKFLSAEMIVSELRGRGTSSHLASPLAREMLIAVAQRIRGDDSVMEALRSVILADQKSQSMAVSLLHAAGATWVPPAKRDVFRKFEACLEGAYLANVCWQGASLKKSNLAGADLSSADLSGAELAGCNALGTDFSNANLTASNMTRACFTKSNLAGATLCSATAQCTVFADANLERARLDGANLAGATFGSANLKNASFFRADLWRAMLLHTQIDGTDFRHARLECADLTRLDLRSADLRGALLRNARLVQCDLQSMHLEGIDFRNAFFEGADLTGASLVGANLTRANLRMTGLADVNMEGACLQQANLHGATFHMGSSRSGLLFSPLASEGTRTGFYTDDFDEQTFKAPEEIRKANLRGADLRGARVDTVDFYLVDLRDALYDPDQEQHFRRCGAILEDLCKK